MVIRSPNLIYGQRERAQWNFSLEAVLVLDATLPNIDAAIKRKETFVFLKKRFTNSSLLGTFGKSGL